MASTYNSRPLVPEVMVRGDRHAVVRPRMNYETMIGQDCLPDWLEQDSSPRSEEHTSELQSLMRISYAVFCLKKKNTKNTIYTANHRLHKKINTEYDMIHS